jgi:hypothetical protein
VKGIIVLDGPDGAGKTHLARFLQERLGAHYIHLTYRWPNRMFDYHTAAIDYAGRLSMEAPVIIDRWWMSEICYANAYRHGSKWPLAWRLFQRVLLKYSGVYVHCLPVNTRKHLDAFGHLKDTRPELYHDILPVTIEYHKLLAMMAGWPNVIRYDRFTDGEDLVDFAKRLEGFRQDLISKQPVNLGSCKNKNFTGHLGLAKYLFIGEQTNQRKKAGSWYPFHEYGASSLHLLQLLDKLNFQEHEGAWTNAHGEPEMSRHLLDRFDLKPICLGSEAFLHVTEGKAHMYSQRNFPKCVLHPAYDKRFPEHYKSAELITQLGSIIHGQDGGQNIYRDNVCISCWNEIMSEDKRSEIQLRAGIQLPRQRRFIDEC